MKQIWIIEKDAPTCGHWYANRIGIEGEKCYVPKDPEPNTELDRLKQHLKDVEEIIVEEMESAGIKGSYVRRLFEYKIDIPGS